MEKERRSWRRENDEFWWLIMRGGWRTEKRVMLKVKGRREGGEREEKGWWLPACPRLQIIQIRAWSAIFHESYFNKIMESLSICLYLSIYLYIYIKILAYQISGCIIDVYMHLIKKSIFGPLRCKEKSLLVITLSCQYYYSLWINKVHSCSNVV